MNLPIIPINTAFANKIAHLYDIGPRRAQLFTQEEFVVSIGFPFNFIDKRRSMQAQDENRTPPPSSQGDDKDFSSVNDLAQVRTDGGPYIQGDVNTNGGDFIVRDKITTIQLPNARFFW